ncbi:MAG TPA: DNA-binding response regulator, partial [Armatimonadetes bacterium]|nr:DNA-binding response regulator [Armatimonadota bacterium]
EVLVAYDGAQALATVRHEQLDLMLLDLMLPIIDGVEVCRQTREMSVLPIIMLTAKTSEQDKITGLEAGADDYIEKPFSNGELTARVRA